jgi:hypothetical protein
MGILVRKQSLQRGGSPRPTAYRDLDDMELMDKLQNLLLWAEHPDCLQYFGIPETFETPP